jgi:DNA-directed RNA polymerase specialized sigma24 family protein
VSGVVARILRSDGDVEDVIEETFWQAWRQADRFVEGRGSVQTWLLTIARSRALDRLRAAKRRREESLDEPARWTRCRRRRTICRRVVRAIRRLGWSVPNAVAWC